MSKKPKIPYENIGIVVQGPVVKTTKQLLVQLRILYPKNEIYLSTWENLDLSVFNIKTVTSQDPGELIYPGESYFRNLNRQIVSTQNGLAQVNAEFAVKIRSDFVVKNGSNPLKVAQRAWKSGKIVMDMNRRHYPFFPWYPSDFFQFGTTTDLRDFWNAPLASQATANYFSNLENVREFQKINFLSYSEVKFAPRWHSEQYLCINYARSKNVEIAMQHRNDVSVSDVLSSYNFMRGYFKVIKKSKLGLVHETHFTDAQFFETVPFKLLSYFSGTRAAKPNFYLLYTLFVVHQFYLFFRFRFLKLIHFLARID